MSSFASRLFAFVDTMFGFNAPAESRGASWTIFSGTMLFGSRQSDH